jgi:two-component system, response regulator RegA
LDRGKIVNVTVLRKNGELPTLLLADADEATERLAEQFATRRYHVEWAQSASEALRIAVRHPPRYAIIGLKLPDDSGLRLLADLLALDPEMRVVVYTGYPSIRTAVEAIRLGAADYLAKPATADQLIAAFDRREGDASVAIGDRPMSMHRVTWEYISHVLQQNNGNVSATARALAIHRRTLQRKLRKRPARA